MKNNSALLHKSIFTVLITCLISFSVIATSCDAKNDIDLQKSDLYETNIDANSYIKDLILYYKNYGREAFAQEIKCINNIRDIDGQKADTWQNIIGYWDYCENDFKDTIDFVPDDLPNDNTLGFIILGLKLKDNGEMEQELIDRLELGLECAKKYSNSTIVVTGGATSNSNKDVTEGDLMGQWLLDHGLDKSRLLVENKSMTTVENSLYTYNLIRNNYPDIYNIALVSSDYHLPRSSLIFYTTYKLILQNCNEKYFNIMSNIGCSVGMNPAETHVRKARHLGEISGISIMEDEIGPSI